MPNIDLDNFNVVKIGNIDIERNYINDILHALASKLKEIETANSSGSVTSVGISTGNSGVGVEGSPITDSGIINLVLGTLASLNDAPSDGTVYGRKDGEWESAATSTYLIRKIAALRAY